MLQQLHIENYAIIDSLKIEFDKGLTIMTGETGAGKSIILGALGLILGKRADTSVLYDKSRKSIIEADFKIKGYKLEPFFEAYELDFDEELIIRREISSTGKTRAFINDTPVKLNVLQELSTQLVDLHQQFDTQEIFKSSFQQKVLDALAKNDKTLSEYQAVYKAFQKDTKELKALKEKSRNVNTEAEFINFQLQEFNEAELQAGEQNQAEEDLNRLNNSEEIKKISTSSYYEILENDGSLIERLEEISRQVENFSSVDPKIQEIYEQLVSAKEELRSVAIGLQDYGDSVEYDEQRINQLNERLEIIYQLQSKHKVDSVDELLSIQAELESRVTNNEAIDAKIKTLSASIQKHEQKLAKFAKTLSDKRKKTSPSLEKAIKKLLSELSMKNAQIKVDLKTMESFGSTGKDQIEFLFSANLGGEFKPLKSVASGGETSRLALCIKSIIADVMHLPTMIFDEIDSGVSGEVALKMGQILSELSQKHQLLSITHSPQIASKADRHFYIYKEVKDKRTVTGIKTLNKSERVTEIAKMLSGDPPSNAAKSNAKELIDVD